MKYTNEQQKIIQAVNDDAIGTVIVNADAGTGKTTTLVKALESIDRNKKVLVISFTNSIVNEIASRLQYQENKNITVSTFHKECLRFVSGSLRDVNDKQEFNILRNYFPSLNSSELAKMRRIFKDANARFKWEEGYKRPDIDYFIKKGISWKDICEARMESLMEAYIYGDLNIENLVSVLAIQMIYDEDYEIEERYGRYDIVIIDEYQDITPLYFFIVNKLGKKLVVVGDIKQQVYCFNGANPSVVSILKELRKDTTIVELGLTQTFRCPEKVVSLVNSRGLGCNMSTANDFNGSVYTGNINDFDFRDYLESEYNMEVNKTDLMIIGRTNRYLLNFFDILYSSGIICRTNGTGSFTDIKIIGMITNFVGFCLGYVHPSVVYRYLSVNRFNKNETMEEDIASKQNVLFEFKDTLVSSVPELHKVPLLRLYKVLEKIGLVEDMTKGNEDYLDVPGDLEGYCKMAFKDMTYSEFIRYEEDKKVFNERNNNNQYGVLLYTIHAAKGLEADNVFLLGTDYGAYFKASTIDRYGLKYTAIQFLEELKLLYVAYTRAKKNLYIFTDADEELHPIFRKGITDVLALTSMLSIDEDKLNELLYRDTFNDLIAYQKYVKKQEGGGAKGSADSELDNVEDIVVEDLNTPSRPLTSKKLKSVLDMVNEIAEDPGISNITSDEEDTEDYLDMLHLKTWYSFKQ